MTEKIIPNGTRLWDEILKAIVDAMPEQLFSLFKEVFGKEYPKGTPIILLATESSTYQENPGAPPSSRLSDIVLLVNGTDYYHLECQMHNDQDMVIRMVAYDLHFAMQYTTEAEQKSKGVVMRFPHSAVMYPEKNRNIPESLRCRIIFQDGSEHIYQIPTVRIQSYSLEEIHEKHLNLFIPYVLLRLRPRLRKEIKNPLTRKELTEFIGEVMIILGNELEQGYLTRREYDDYVNLFRRAAEKVFEKHDHFRKEVDRMTKPIIELPSVIQKRLYEENDELIAKNKALMADNDALMADNNALLADKNALLADLADKDDLLADKNALLADLADKDAQLAKMRKLLEQHHIIECV